MANRYRLYPTGEQVVFMAERHCAGARYLWNLAVEAWAAAKAGLNKNIYANCWGMFAGRLGQKMKACGTTLVAVSARYSSQQCRKCGHTAKENRESQAVFRCVACGHGDRADHNAAQIILARARPARTPGPGPTPQGVGTARCAHESENSGWAA